MGYVAWTDLYGRCRRPSWDSFRPLTRSRRRVLGPTCGIASKTCGIVVRTAAIVVKMYAIAGKTAAIVAKMCAMPVTTAAGSTGSRIGATVARMCATGVRTVAIAAKIAGTGAKTGAIASRITLAVTNARNARPGHRPSVFVIQCMNKAARPLMPRSSSSLAGVSHVARPLAPADSSHRIRACAHLAQPHPARRHSYGDRLLQPVERHDPAECARELRPRSAACGHRA